MQLFALTEKNELISATLAEKQTDYICPECRSRVRARAGIYRTPHFFHLDEERTCRQSGKSLEHLQAQFRLQQMIPEIKLELPFPSIGRIADAAWEKEKVIFEIQCSPITAEELRARNRDYAGIGWTTIWIFHEERYNKRRITAAEGSVWKRAHYYTNIDQEGKGDFFSHLSTSHQGKREKTILRRRVAFVQPIWNGQKLHFEGDGWETFFEHREKISLSDLFQSFTSRLFISVRAIFDHFVEKSCH